MSQEGARAFVDKMNRDGSFRMRVLSERTVEDRMRMIRAAGFDCTAKEIGLASAEISDDEAAGASGGIAFTLDDFSMHVSWPAR